MPDLPPAVRAAAERIRDGIRTQDAEMLDAWGTRLGPGAPRPARDDLLELLDHVGVPVDEPRAEGLCGEDLEVWGVTTRCVREPGHPVSEDDPHRNGRGTQWWPRTVEESARG